MPTPAILRLGRLHALAIALWLSSLAAPALAVSSAEIYNTAAYQYGRIEARMRFAFGDGIVSSFFLWKEGSELDGTFWNELDFEKLRANCELETNALYGDPEMSHNALFDSDQDLCGQFHVYAYEWTPEYVAWFVDDVEIRREGEATAAAFRDNAAQGMRIHFNIWPGDASFGGNFDPAILPAHQYVDWVQYSAYAEGAFELQWREDFDAGSLPASWATANWGSPKNLSTHAAANVGFAGGYAVLALTADDATGSLGDVPMEMETPGEPPAVADAGSAGAGGSDPTDDSVPPDPPSDAGGSGGSGGSNDEPIASGTTDTDTDSAPPSQSGVAGAPALTSGPSVNPPQVPPTGAGGSPAVPGNTAQPAPMPTPSHAPMASASPEGAPVPSATSASPAAGEAETDDGGCACRVARNQPPPRGVWIALGAAGLGWIRRNRRSPKTRLTVSRKAHPNGSENVS